MNGKQLKNSILQWAIQGKLVPQDPNDEPASVLLQRIRTEKERLIKEGKIKRSRKSAKTSDTRHYEQMPFDVPQGWVWCRLDDTCQIFGRIGFRGYTKEDLVEKGKGAITLSPSNIMRLLHKSSGAIETTFSTVSNEKYVLYVINMHRQALKENKVGSAIPHLNKKLFKAIEVPIPPYAEQERIIVAINTVFRSLDTIEESL